MTDVLATGSEGVDGESISNAVEASRFNPDNILSTLQKSQADAIVLVWDGESSTGHGLIEYAFENGVPIHVESEGYDGIFKNNLTEQELLRRFPELKQVDDLQLRGQAVEALLSGHPDYIWEAPSSGSGKYHPPDERSKHGQWLHVKRMFYAYDEMAESLVEAGEITAREKETGKIAVFFHDMFKNGIPPSDRGKSVNTHDLLAANYVRHCTNLPELVADLCETHNGPWGSGRNPDTAHEWVFHEADMIASRNASNLGVYEPTEEIRGISDQLIDAGER